MKLKTIIAISTLAPSLASAFTVSIANQLAFGDPSLPILDNTGAPLTSGSFGVGAFSDNAAITGNSQDFTALLAGFTQFGSTTPLVEGAAPGLVNLNTPEELDVVVPFGTTGGLIGQDVFVVIGNGDTLEGSDQLAIFRSSNAQFGTDDAAGQGGVIVDLSSDTGDLLLGDNTGPTDVSAGAASITFTDNIQLVAAGAGDVVPEPSTSLLAGLAALGLVARRRR